MIHQYPLSVEIRCDFIIWKKARNSCHSPCNFWPSSIVFQKVQVTKDRSAHQATSWDSAQRCQLPSFQRSWHHNFQGKPPHENTITHTHKISPPPPFKWKHHHTENLSFFCIDFANTFFVSELPQKIDFSSPAWARHPQPLPPLRPHGGQPRIHRVNATRHFFLKLESIPLDNLISKISLSLRWSLCFQKSWVNSG